MARHVPVSIPLALAGVDAVDRDLLLVEVRSDRLDLLEVPAHVLVLDVFREEHDLEVAAEVPHAVQRAQADP